MIRVVFKVKLKHVSELGCVLKMFEVIPDGNYVEVSFYEEEEDEKEE